jgi:hypothetical protein
LLNESGYSLLSVVTPVLNAAEGTCDIVICRGDAAVTWIAEPNNCPEKPLLEEASRAINEEG